MLFISHLTLSLLAFTISRSSAGAQTQNATHRGDLFTFEPDLGACGYKNTTQQIVASVSREVFNTFPGATTNPNKNPICHQKVLIKSPDGKTTLTAPIVDYFVAPNATYNIGLSRAGFAHFGDLTDGVVRNVTWSVV